MTSMKTLYESILDDEDEVMDKMGDDIMKNKIENWLNDRNNCTLEEVYVKRGVILNDLTINTKDYSINYEGSIIIYKDLPNFIKFNKIKGECQFYGPKITTLKGSPKEVDGLFRCDHLPNLKSLVGGPEKVATMFDCSVCPKLKSLKGCPKEVGGNFLCGVGVGQKPFAEKEVRQNCKVGVKIYGAEKDSDIQF